MATVAETARAAFMFGGALIKRFACTGGTTAASITHGESRSPDFCIVTATDGGNPTQTGIGVDYTTSATVLTVDCVVDAAETFDIVAVWLNPSGASATGGVPGY
jgi:hypothetical protein